MKKLIIAIVAVIVVAAAAVGGYFAFFDEKPDDNAAQVVATNDGELDGDNVRYIEAVMKNPDRYKPLLLRDYGMSEETVEEFYNAPEEWLYFDQILRIDNLSEESITVYSFEVPDNGKNGVYVSTKLGGDLGVAPGGYGPAVMSVFCSNGELSTEEVADILGKMEINIVYTKTPVEYDDGTESVEETKIAAVNLGA